MNRTSAAIPTPVSERLTDERVLILDFGSQYAQLIARRVRELQVYCEIVRHDITVEQVRRHRPQGLILSGGPASVYDAQAPQCDPGIFQMGIPVLGICYGMQLACKSLGGLVDRAPAREYGRAHCVVQQPDALFREMPADLEVWMSHGDQVLSVSDEFEPLATTPTCPIAAVKHRHLPVFGLQFHPEVTHTPAGRQILGNFLTQVCGCRGDWTMGNFAQQAIEHIRRQVGAARVICGLSGGVDSAVTAALIYQAIGPQLSCILVDNGLLRKNEQAAVISEFTRHFRTDLHVVQAEDKFLSALANVSEPQEKRRRIGHAFIECFTAEAAQIEDAKFLAQGTLYPDVIESVSFTGGPSVTIKSHHNVGGLPEKMNLKLVEPLRELFKDEVRELGRELGMPEDFIRRHPFPGPGLAIRIPGMITKEKLEILRKADLIYLEEIRNANLYDAIWQAFAVLLPVQTVGVMGDARTYDFVCALRAVTSVDGMTADYFHFDHEFLSRVSTRIINEVKGINRVVYDITSKPPGTIEWE